MQVEGPIVAVTAAPLLLEAAVPFDPTAPKEAFSQVPEASGIFALFAEDPRAEPYLAKASHLRRRLQRFLSPAPSQSRRLELASRIRRIEFSVTGSDFASDLAFYNAAAAVRTLVGQDRNGRDPRGRLRLRPTASLKRGMDNQFPRAYVTTSLPKGTQRRSTTSEPVGPFPSRAGAERYLEEVLDLFLLRRCVENLDPDPLFPGCVYGEMKKCLAPCNVSCTAERYLEEAQGVRDFLLTRGESLLQAVAAERERAAEALEFERAAALHARYEKVKTVAAAMPSAARPLSQLNGILIQPGPSPDLVALFSVRRGAIVGPVTYSTIGMRLHNELSGSSSLFTQPMALEPVPLAGSESAPAAVPQPSSKDMLDTRLDEALASLERIAAPTSTPMLADHLSLFARWYYRPESRRVGEILFAGPDGSIPTRPLLRAISRVAAAVQFGAGAPGAKPSKWHA